MSKKLGRSGDGMSEKGKGEGVGRKGIACNFTELRSPSSFAHERGAMAQFDWLVARQSKSDIKKLTYVHNRHPEYKTTNKIKNVAESVEAFEFSLQETLKDLSKTSKQIDLKLEQGAAIKSLVHGQDVLAILPTGFGKCASYQILLGVKEKMSKDCACVLVICPLRCPLLILRVLKLGWKPFSILLKPGNRLVF